jgi:hypothetical protein
MFDSFARGLRMIWASIKMGWSDKRLLLPSILTVFLNIFFGMTLIVVEQSRVGHGVQSGMHQIGQMSMAPSSGGHGGSIGSYGIPGGMPAAMKNIMSTTGAPNTPGDQGGFGQLATNAYSEATTGKDGGLLSGDNALMVMGIMMIWWLCNRFLEGVTTGLVYSFLTEGKGSGKFSLACQAVLSSLPAIVLLGLATMIAKKVAAFLRNKRSEGVLGMGFNFLAGIVEVFWTLAGHLILPAIVIEGCSFWGGLKRADKIASGNLLTIGVGEVGVDGICQLLTWGLYGLGMTAAGAAVYLKWIDLGAHYISPVVIPFVVAWMGAVVACTAMSIYIRAAFYTCLYVWAIEAEACEEAGRQHIKPPEPLALALA